MKWQKALLVSLPPILTSLGIWGIWYGMSGEDEVSAAPAGSVSPMSSEVGSVVAGAEDSEVPEGAPESVNREDSTESIGKPEEKKDSAYYAEVFSQRGGALSAHELWKAFVRHPDSLKIVVKAVEQMAGGNRPLVFLDLPFLPPLQVFSAERSGDFWVMGAATEGRFTGAVACLVEMDPAKVSALFKEMEPEFDRILHEDFGYPPEEGFRKLLFECLEVVLKTPVPEASPQLVQVTSKLYRYELRQLEELNDCQKFVLRLGPVNQAKVQDYLRRLWDAL